MDFTRRIDNSIYPRKALADARKAYDQYCTVRAVPCNNGIVDITVSVKREYKQDARQIILEFWNYCLDTACQQRIEMA